MNTRTFGKCLILFILFHILLALGSASPSSEMGKVPLSYPWKEVVIDALESRSWHGIVFASPEQTCFAFRFAIYYQGKLLDGLNVYFAVSRVGPHAPDGSYSMLEIDPTLGLDVTTTLEEAKETPLIRRDIIPTPPPPRVRIEWSRIDEYTVVGRVTAPFNCQVIVEAFYPWSFQGSYGISDEGDAIAGSSSAPSPHYRDFALVVDSKADASGTFPSLDALYEKVKGGRKLTDRGAQPVAALMYGMEDREALHFAARIGMDFQSLAPPLRELATPRNIASILEEKRRRYEGHRVRTEGLFAHTAEAITNNLGWMILYQPDTGGRYIPAGRRWIFPKLDNTLEEWTIFEWDSFFNALELALEDKEMAYSMLREVLDIMYPNGNIPNWRGGTRGTLDRSQPPVGGYCTWKVYLRWGKEKELLQMAYPKLKKWHRWWLTDVETGKPRRDGNQDGLLEWGGDKGEYIPSWEDASGLQRAKWESGMDDSPLWDEATYDEGSWTMKLNALDLNCLYALDSRCLSLMAQELNLPQEAAHYRQEYERLKGLINAKMWDPKTAFYYDQFWDGRLSRAKAASSFYPLLAGIASPQQADQMVKHLLNEEEFWGDYILPTISRDHPFFNDQQYWRGTIWPPTNYLVYQGLKSYGYDQIASHYAERSVRLFIGSWLRYQLCRENYDSRTGEGGGRRYQSWGPLFCLIGIEEFIDYEPFGGLRLGSSGLSQESKISHVPLGNHLYDVTIGPQLTEVFRDGKLLFRADRDVVVRNFTCEAGMVRFHINARTATRLQLPFAPEGKAVKIEKDGAHFATRKVTGGLISLEIPAGKAEYKFSLVEE